MNLRNVGKKSKFSVIISLSSNLFLFFLTPAVRNPQNLSGVLSQKKKDFTFEEAEENKFVKMALSRKKKKNTIQSIKTFGNRINVFAVFDSRSQLFHFY